MLLKTGKQTQKRKRDFAKVKQMYPNGFLATISLKDRVVTVRCPGNQVYLNYSTANLCCSVQGEICQTNSKKMVSSRPNRSLRANSPDKLDYNIA